MENERELLDPEAWTAVLDSYAQAMQVAVALTGPDGRLMGICHNPQPVWSLARGATVEWAGCPFCLQTKNACSAAAEARRTGSIVLVHDLAGLAHVALPLLLGDRYVGTLLATAVENLTVLNLHELDAALRAQSHGGEPTATIGSLLK